jgi:hypothetical protein
VTCTKENGKTIRLMDTELTSIWTEPSTWASGLMTNKTGMEKKSGQTVPAIKESTFKGKSMELANSNGPTDQCTTVSSAITTSKDMESINGLMGESMMENGKIIKWMEKG